MLRHRYYAGVLEHYAHMQCRWSKVAVTVSGKSVHIDGYKIYIMQDVDTINLVHLSDAVLEVKYRCVIDCHFEFIDCTEDLHLERKRRSCKYICRAQVCIQHHK